MKPLQRPRLYRCRQRHLWLRLFFLVGVLCCVMTWGDRTALHAQDPSQLAMSFGAGRAFPQINPTVDSTLPLWLDAPATVDFSLHPLSASALRQLYQAYSPYNPPLLDVTAYPALLTWRQQFTAIATDVPEQVALPATRLATLVDGAYILRAAQANGSTATTVVLISRHALVVKRGYGGQVVVWATDRQNRTVTPGMQVTLFDGDGIELASAVTAADGTATLAVGMATPSMAVGTVPLATGAAQTYAGLDWQWRVEDTLWSWQESALPHYRVFLHSDRLLYRPGQQIHYQALIRQLLPNGLATPATTTPIAVQLRDARGNVIDSATATPDHFGTVSGHFQLGDEPTLGAYELSIAVDGEVTSSTLQVAAYHKPDYAVTVTVPTTFALSGSPLPVTVEAAYFLGQPVANATVLLQIYQTNRSMVEWWSTSGTESTSQQLIHSISGVTDATGLWQTTIVPLATAAMATEYTLQATVTDLAAEPVSAVTTVPLYDTAVALTVATERYGYLSQTPIAVQLAARTHDGMPLADQSITLRVTKPATDGTVDVQPAQQLTTAADGTATAAVADLAVGWYQLLATTNDARGQPVTAQSYLWIYGGAFPAQPATAAILQIVPDRNSYAPGEIAHLLIHTPVTGTALLTLERNRVEHEQLVQLTGDLTTVDLPIRADYAPNMFVQLHLFAPTTATTASTSASAGELLSAQTELVVPPTTQSLQVTIHSDATTYRPGATAQLTVRVTDHAGDPARARVALALVDEAIFALQPTTTPSLLHTFYGTTANQVATFHSLARQTSEHFYPPIMDRTEPQPAELTAEWVGTLQSRQTFQDTAYWNARLETDANGESQVTLTLPDNLTRWRVMAWAITADSAVGEQESSLRVTQSLVVRPQLPHFAVLGDQFRSGALAHDFAATSAQGQLTLAAPAFTVLDQSTQAVPLHATGAAVYWTTVASQLGQATVTTTLRSALGGDQVISTVPVHPFAVPKRWTVAGSAMPTATATFTVPLTAINDATILTVQLAPALALGLLDGLADLIDYPYGCVEQTMSRLLPSAVAARAFTEFGIDNPKADQLPMIFDQGRQTLYGYQHSDGSWGWFYDDDGGVYLTSYVLFGLTQLQAAGVAVDEGVLTRGFTYLDLNLKAADPNSQAYALYVKAVAGRGDLATAQTLAAAPATLDTAALAALILALHHDGDQVTSARLTSLLLARVQETATTAYWPLTTGAWTRPQWRTMAAPEKSTALALQAVLATQPDHPLLPKVVRWLMQQRQGAGWRNTQATAQAILALAAYSQHYQEAAATYQYHVYLNGQTVQSGAVTPTTSRQPLPPITIHGDGLLIGDNTLTIEQSGSTTPLYYTVQLAQQQFYDSAGAIPAMAQGIGLTRSYRLVAGNARADGAYSIGDVVEVSLAVEAAEELAYLLVDDPIPAGFTPIADQLNPVSYGDQRTFAWPHARYNRKTVRDDRVEFFLTTVVPGQTVLTYRMRAAIAGSFGVPPGQVYTMYNDSYWGRSTGSTVRITPELLTQRPSLPGDIDGDCRISQFDAQLLAARWGTTATPRDPLAGHLIDLHDLAAVVARQGATCLQDWQAPTAEGNAMSLRLAMPTTTFTIGQPIAVAIYPPAPAITTTAGEQLGGYSLVLNFDPTVLRVVDVVWQERNAHTLRLGPLLSAETGQLQLGAHGVVPQTHPTEPLVTVHFAAHGEGNTAITATRVEAVDGQGRTVAATVVPNNDQLTIQSQQSFLPLIQQ